MNAKTDNPNGAATTTTSADRAQLMGHDDGAITLTLDARLFRALHACAQESGVRFYMHGYSLSVTGDVPYLTTTDGHTLARTPVHYDADEHTGAVVNTLRDAPVIIPRLERALVKSAETVTITIKGSSPGRTITIAATAKNGRPVSNLPPYSNPATAVTEIDGSFPDVTRVLPDPGKLSYQYPEGAEYGLNPVYLSRAAQHLSYTEDFANIRLRYSPDMDPIVVEVSAWSEVTLLVMPCRW